VIEEASITVDLMSRGMTASAIAGDPHFAAVIKAALERFRHAVDGAEWAKLP
jgi:hypothetical protein